MADSEHMGPLRGISQMTTVLWVLEFEPRRFSKLDVLRAYLSSAALKSWSDQYGVGTLCSSRRRLAFPPSCGFMGRLCPSFSCLL